jgi:DNA mismatch repair protein MSH6
MPWVMRQMLVEEERGGLEPNEECALAWSAVGGLVAHLEHCLIAYQLLDQGTFDAYVPGDLANETSVVPCDSTEGDSSESSSGSESCVALPPFMTLDVHAIRNLEIFENTYDRGTSGTLFEFLNYTKTPMGKRLYRSWIAAPLCRPTSVYKRLDAVEDLCHLSEERDALRQKLSKVPDLEKLVSFFVSIPDFRRLFLTIFFSITAFLSGVLDSHSRL